jgi:hypothetical protein
LCASVVCTARNTLFRRLTSKSELLLLGGGRVVCRRQDLVTTVIIVRGQRRHSGSANAWSRDDGKGINVALVALPLNGKLVIREPNTPEPCN